MANGTLLRLHAWTARGWIKESAFETDTPLTGCAIFVDFAPAPLANNLALVVGITTLPDSASVEPLGVFSAGQTRCGRHPLAQLGLAQLPLRAVGVCNASRPRGHNHTLIQRAFGALSTVRRACAHMVEGCVMAATRRDNELDTEGSQQRLDQGIRNLLVHGLPAGGVMATQTCFVHTCMLPQS